LLGGPTASRTASWERVTAAAGGLALLVQGLHHLINSDGRPGDLVHDAAGMITFDPATGRYRFVTHLANGQAGVFDGTFEDDRFRWFIPAGPATIRYEIARDGDRGWDEQGFYCPPGSGTSPGGSASPSAPATPASAPACQRFFTMKLQRQ
jgi:hypothetical protein